MNEADTHCIDMSQALNCIRHYKVYNDFNKTERKSRELVVYKQCLRLDNSSCLSVCLSACALPSCWCTVEGVRTLVGVSIASHWLYIYTCQSRGCACANIRHEGLHYTVTQVQLFVLRVTLHTF